MTESVQTTNTSIRAFSVDVLASSLDADKPLTIQLEQAVLSVLDTPVSLIRWAISESIAEANDHRYRIEGAYLKQG